MKIKLTKVNDTDFEGERFIFAEFTDGNFTIENKDYESLGSIERIRVGTWMQWCILLRKDCYLSPGCTDEAREMQRILGSNKKKDENNK